MAKGLIETITGLSIPSSPAPQCIDMLNGFPLTNLVGLYMLDDGTIGSAMPTSIDNDAPAGSDAAFTGVPSSITRRSYGMEMNPASSVGVYQTGLNLTASFTAIVAARFSGATGVNWGFPTFFRRTAANDGAINVEADTSAIDGQLGFFSSVTSPVRLNLTGSKGREPSAVAVRFDDATGTVTLRDHAGRSATSTTPGAIGHFAGLSSDTWRFGFQASSTMSGEFYCAAIYNAPIADAMVTYALQAARAVMVARGLTPAT